MNILIIGATSAIARSISRLYAVKNAKLFLLARDEERLRESAADLKLRGASDVKTLNYDAENTKKHSKMLFIFFMI